MNPPDSDGPAIIIGFTLPHPACDATFSTLLFSADQRSCTRYTRIASTPPRPHILDDTHNFSTRVRHTFIRPEHHNQHTTSISIHTFCNHNLCWDFHDSPAPSKACVCIERCRHFQLDSLHAVAASPELPCMIGYRVSHFATTITSPLQQMPRKIW